MARRFLWLGVCAAWASMAPADDPDYYIRRETWHASMLASLEALAREPLRDGAALWQSPIMRGGDAAVSVTLDVAEADAIYLFVTGCPDVIWGVGTWAGARLIAEDGGAVDLSRYTPLAVIEGQAAFDLTLRSGLDQKLSIAGRAFERGINVLADSVIRVPLGKKFARFESLAGIDDWAGERGNVRFIVAGERAAARLLLWELLARDFPERAPRTEMRREREDGIFLEDWDGRDMPELARRYIDACPRADSPASPGDVRAARAAYHDARRAGEALRALSAFDFTALRLAIEDLAATFGGRYGRAGEFLAALDACEREAESPRADATRAVELRARIEGLKRDALLANPLLDFDELLLVRRVPAGDPRRSRWADRGLGEYLGMPRQSSWHLGTMTNADAWVNEIALLSPVRPDGALRTLFAPEGTRLVTDVDLRFDAEKLLFSMPDSRKRFQIHEIDARGRNLRQLTPSGLGDVHCYDACYLPSGSIAFLSTAPLQGVPCNAAVIVGMMYRMNADGSGIRQMCFEQDHDYCPSVLNDGRVLYLRWDYTDTPHVWNRLLMSMNPDGTGQMEFYGANSYWPNAVFFARAIPGSAAKVAGIATGHHEGRVGELVIFDAARGRREADGVVQRIPGRGRKVAPRIEDKLTEHSWPKFLHPWPLSEKYFLAACKPAPDDLWGIYLVDVFDNMVLVREEERRALLEPIPFRPVRRPPVIPEHEAAPDDDAIIFLMDVYQGPGMRGIPRGTVKRLRVFTYHFGYQKLAGIDHRVGADGPWECKRVLGTVPVEEDGSAMFRAPSKMPLSLQPLDAEGKAVALMRSWLTAQPGEVLSCVGCHEQKSSAPPSMAVIAARKAPSEIAPWHGPVRGFSFAREVGPVLDTHCVGCHGGGTPPDLRADQGFYVAYEGGNPEKKIMRGARKEDLLGKFAAVFEPAYVELRKYVRVGGLESDLHELEPMEFHAGTSELVQMLAKGHHGVALDAEAWDRIVTWIDLNAPCHGTWAETTRIPGDQRARRMELRRFFGGRPEDGEDIPALPPAAAAPIVPALEPAAPAAPVAAAAWPFDAAEAQRRRSAAGAGERTLDLGGGVSMELVRIPAGEFVMGDPAGERDERPCTRVAIAEPFWMGRCEVTNRQYACFDLLHDSRFEHRTSWIFSEEYLGWRLDRPDQPVVRVSWEEAAAFCAWLSGKTGARVTLPTEAQWEYACRAGTATPLTSGAVDADYARCANMGDASLRRLAYEGWRPRSPDLVPRDDGVNDGALVTADVRSYLPNAWGLHDMHGNAAEWTASAYLPYPFREDPGAAAAEHGARRVVRGGSWRDRAERCRSSFRLAYPAYQKVYNVGFRVAVTP
ncbi:MAG TPA: hypothetical protein DCM87_08675 [Planctomycetes bacterium]|nr:hypothetical protein [Planctomycetota bacterium]